MFRDLMKIWNSHSFSSSIVDEFVSMLDSSREMLSYCFDTLTSKGEPVDAQKNIYFKDQSINLKEQDIRKQILVHISTNPKGNLPAWLTLISVSKDAERLGDYVKNIFELSQLAKDSKKDRKLFKSLFSENGDELLELFETVAKSYRSGDKALALRAVNSGKKISGRCEEIIEEVIDSDYSNRQAVVVALGARYMKRIALHLSNIASSIINTLPELDYLTEQDDVN